MAISTLKGKNVSIALWAPVQEVESSALDQLKNIAALPWVYHHVAAMADVHYGKGATVGSVIAMKDALAPAAVGVDIGCGLLALKTNLNHDKIDRKLAKVRTAVEEAIPVGFNSHDEPAIDRVQSLAVRNQITALMNRFKDLNQHVQNNVQKVWKQIGTLGSGNHFLELCLDTGKCHCDNGAVFSNIGYNKCDDCNGKGVVEPSVWLMLHSGSRNVGKELAEFHIGVARKLTHNQTLPDKDLAVFLSGTTEMENYRHDLYWAQEYALVNRAVMIDLYKQVLAEFCPSLEVEDTIQCHHNYVAEEVHFGENVLVTRKGAIRAQRGDLGIIPGSMGTKSFIVKGLGNPDSFNSASHGAGRKMSRGAAKRKFTIDDLRRQTAGVECRKDNSVLDEIPGAYKNIDKVMANQNDLVEIVAELKQVLCVKG